MHSLHLILAVACAALLAASGCTKQDEVATEKKK